MPWRAVIDDMREELEEEAQDAHPPSLAVD